MSSGQLTRSQINGIVSNGFIERGGFNCRHQWVALSPKTQNRDIQKKAKVAYQGMVTKAKLKGRSFSIPQTLEQYYND